MSGLELAFATIELHLQFGSPLTAVSAQLPDTFAPLISHDDELHASYLELPAYGLSMNFEDDALSAVFLTISDAEDGFAPYQGRASFLPDAFFAAPTLDAYKSSLLGAGFDPAPQKVAHITPMTGHGLRFSYAIFKHGTRITVSQPRP